MPKKTPIIAFHDATGKIYPFKLLTASTMKTALRPYAAELGLLANAWNSLHRNLSFLFWILLRAPNPYAGHAIWHSADSDIVQRKMLRALIEADDYPVPPEYPKKLSSEQMGDLLYILDEIDRSLRHKRNNAIHAPLFIMSGVHHGAVRRWAEADFNPQNPRARPLRGKDLIEEFRNYTAELERLSGYANAMWLALNPEHGGRFSWPKKPPALQAHKKKRAGRRGIPRLPAHRLKA